MRSWFSFRYRVSTEREDSMCIKCVLFYNFTTSINLHLSINKRWISMLE